MHMPRDMAITAVRARESCRRDDGIAFYYVNARKRSLPRLQSQRHAGWGLASRLIHPPYVGEHRA